MEVATTPPETEAPAAPEPEAEAPTVVPETNEAETQTPERLFRYSTFVDIGEGSDTCEDKRTGKCANVDHFHCWIRLPNQFQHSTIRTKALAHKARIMRQFNDDESDRYWTLAGELDAMRAAPGAHLSLVEELVKREFTRYLKEAVDEVKEQEGFETISEDFDRMNHLDSLDPETRDQAEYDELIRHIETYHKAVEATRDELEKPLRTALEQQGVDDLIEKIRIDKIDVEATQEFMRVYADWQMFTCTYIPRPADKGRPNEKRWPDIAVMREESAEVLENMEREFALLEEALRSGN